MKNTQTLKRHKHGLHNHPRKMIRNELELTPIEFPCPTMTRCTAKSCDGDTYTGPDYFSSSKFICRDVRRLISDHLNGTDCRALASTCRNMFSIISDNRYWFYRLQKDFYEKPLIGRQETTVTTQYKRKIVPSTCTGSGTSAVSGNFTIHAQFKNTQRIPTAEVWLSHSQSANQIPDRPQRCSTAGVPLAIVCGRGCQSLKRWHVQPPECRGSNVRTLHRCRTRRALEERSEPLWHVPWRRVERYSAHESHQTRAHLGECELRWRGFVNTAINKTLVRWFAIFNDMHRNQRATSSIRHILTFASLHSFCWIQVDIWPRIYWYLWRWAPNCFCTCC